MKGYIHVYTGNGKGKTTAAFGLAVRAMYSGKRVYIGQFVKGMKYHETGLDVHDAIDIEQYGETCMISREPDEKDIQMAREGLDKINKIIQSGKYDLVILDELTIALYYKLLKVIDVLEVLKAKPEETEIVITGRYAPEEIIDFADLVTEMKEVKHYYKQGVVSRPGIDH